MDGFDDLLAPSRRALEDNPFANPFSSDRSHSPDPWASPFASTQQDDAFGSSSALDPYANPYESLGAPSSRHQDQESEEGDRSTTATTSPTTTKAEELPLSDPLDSAAHANGDDDEPSPPRLPGFRESHASPQPSFNETATIRPSEPERFDEAPVASTTQPRPITPPSITPKTPQTTEIEHIQESRSSADPDAAKTASGFIAHSPVAPASESEPVKKAVEFSPLPDGGIGGGLGIDRSLAGLTLGEDGYGSGIGGSSGWGGDHGWGVNSEPIPSTSTASAFVGASTTQQPDDDDSDDDKPISQTLSRIQSEDPDRAVCLRRSSSYFYDDG
jgi:sorting nexin-1/2